MKRYDVFLRLTIMTVALAAGGCAISLEPADPGTGSRPDAAFADAAPDRVDSGADAADAADAAADVPLACGDAFCSGTQFCLRGSGGGAAENASEQCTDTPVECDAGLSCPCLSSVCPQGFSCSVDGRRVECDCLTCP